MNEKEHDSQHEQILKELDKVAETLVQKDEGDTDMLKRIEALENALGIVK
jgi:hypothetical protein